MVQKVNKYHNNSALSIAFGVTDITGLVVSHNAGSITRAGGVINEIAAGTVTVPASVSFSIYLDLDTNTVESKATASILSTDSYQVIYDGVSGSSDVTSLRDLRSWTSTKIGTAGASGSTYAQLVAAIDPGSWYRFDEASGGVLNQGSQGSALDLAEGTYGTAWSGTYAQEGVPISDESSTGAMLFGGGGRLTAGTNRWGTQATGTMFFIVDMTNVTSQRFMWGVTLGADLNQIHGIAQADKSFTLDWASTGSNNSSLTTSSTLSGWHSIAIVQTDDSVNGPDMYVDGVIDSSAVLSADGGVGYDFWFDAFTPDTTAIGARGGITGTAKYNGLMDEFFYVDTTELTATQILDLHNAAFGL